MLSYLDAASGQMILAALAGGAAGIAVLFKFYGYRFLGMFSKKYRAKAEGAQLDLIGEDEETDETKAEPELVGDPDS